MDGASAAASIIAIWQFTEVIIKFAHDTIKAPEEYQKLASELESIRFVLKKLQAREDEAQKQPGITYYNGILQLRHPDGPLARLKATAETFADELRPREGYKHKIQRLRYHWDKKKFEEYLDDIDRYDNQIGRILDGDQFELSLHSQASIEEVQGKVNATYVLGQETNALAHMLIDSSSEQGLALRDVADRMESLEFGQQDERERARKKEEEQEKEDILRWLSPLKSLDKQRQLLEGSFRTGNWFLEESIEFRKWQEGRPWPLYAQGEPGSGKTILSAFTAEYLQKRFYYSKSPVLCVYLEQKNQKNQTPVILLGDLIKQFLQVNESQRVPDRLKTAYRKAKVKQTTTLSEQDLVEIFVQMVDSYDRVYVLVDALDEGSVQAGDWLRDRLPHLHAKKCSVMFTSRDTIRESEYGICCDAKPEGEAVHLYWRCNICDAGDGFYDVCQNCVDEGLHCKDSSHELKEMVPVEITIATPEDELKQYVKAEIDREIGKAGTGDWDPKLYSKTRRKGFGGQLARDPSLQEEMLEIIPERADQKFIYAKLYMDTLKQQRTLADIDQVLHSLPRNIEEQYDQIISERIEKQESPTDRQNSMKIIAFVCCASTGRNLRLRELQHALAIRAGDKTYNARREMDRYDILEITMGLISIDEEEDGAIVRPFHLTLQEWFNGEGEKWFPTAHLDMANACLNYLNLDEFSSSTSIADVERRVKDYPFAAYASQEWGHHVHNAGGDSHLQDAVLHYVRDDERISAWSQLAWCSKARDSGGWDVRKQVDGLFVCAWFGLHDIIDKWSQLKVLDVDAQEATYGQTPLMYACRKGYIQTVSKLLELGASPQLRNAKGRTALFEAVQRYAFDFLEELEIDMTDELVDLLIRDKNVDVNLQDKFGFTALLNATEMQHLLAVRSLLQHPQINFNQQDPAGVTSLSRAVLVEWEDGVSALLEKTGIDVNLAEAGYRTPLILAAERDLKNIVQALLDHGADAESKDAQGATAVMRAISEKAMEATNALLNHGVNLTCTEEQERGLLHMAAATGDSKMIEILRSKGLSIDVEDKFGMSPLHVACQHGSVEAVKILVESGSETAMEDCFGRNPAIIAWQYGRDEIVEFLRKKAKETKKPFQLPPNDDLPIWSMATRGLEELLEAMLASSKVDISVVEPITRDTALHCAVNGGKTGIFRILLDKTTISLTSRNYREETPLHFAAMDGNSEVTTLLVERGAELDAVDKWGLTPLSIAQKNSHFDVAIYLLEAGASIEATVPSSEKLSGSASHARFTFKQFSIKRLFFAAVENNSVVAVKRLIDAGADILAVNDAGYNARDIAKKSGSEDMQRLLTTSRSYYYAVPAQKESNEKEEKVGDTGEEEEGKPPERTESMALAGSGEERVRMAFPMPTDAIDEA
ncbi:MAG: hypothetical protein M1820_006586 [Bogoriella megaspora]|nr:MAG: hypothetical protein M1820_006586 [Bogoriella megaspora]